LTARTTQELYDRFCDGGSAQKNLSEREQDFEDLIDSLGSITVAASDASNSSKGKADYVCDGTADDVEINAAIDALPSGGGKVLLSEGTFNITSQIIMYDDQTLEGMGTSTILFLVAGSNVGLIRNEYWGVVSSNYRIAIRNLVIDGNKDNNASVANDGAVSIRSIVDVWIENVWVKDFRGFAGIYVSPGAVADDTRDHIINCHVQGCSGTGSYGNGIYLTGASHHGRIIGCTVDAVDGYGIFTEDNAADISIIGCSVKDVGKDGIHVNKGVNVLISGCTIDGSTQNGIETSSTLEGLTISGCAIQNSTLAGISLNADVGDQVDIAIYGNTIHDFSNSWAGIFLQRTSTYTVKRVAITGNVISNGGGNAVSLAEAGMDNVLIKGNNFTGITGNSIRVYDATIEYSTDVTAISDELDLSAAATDVVVFHATMPCQLVGYEILYTEASSADAGVDVRVGIFGDDNHLDNSTSEVSQSIGYVKEFITGDLTRQKIDSGDTVTVGTAGGKTGTGNVRIVLKIAEMAIGNT
jgi:hypothetical protein